MTLISPHSLHPLPWKSHQYEKKVGIYQTDIIVDHSDGKDDTPIVVSDVFFLQDVQFILEATNNYHRLMEDNMRMRVFLMSLIDEGNPDQPNDETVAEIKSLLKQGDK